MTIPIKHQIGMESGDTKHARQALLLNLKVAYLCFRQGMCVMQIQLVF